MKKRYFVLSTVVLLFILLTQQGVKGAQLDSAHNSLKNAFEVPFFPYELYFKFENSNQDLWIKFTLTETQTIKLTTKNSLEANITIYSKKQLESGNDDCIVSTHWMPVAYKLDAGQVSEPVKTTYGYHIIKVTDKKELKPFDEVKDSIRKDIEQQRLQDTTGKWKQQVVNELLKDADIKVNDKEFKNTFEFLEKK